MSDTVKFIGDLSLQDADVLESCGRLYRRILEFGVGGSTQILAQCEPDEFVSLDTDDNWMDITVSRLAQLENITSPEMYMYEEGMRSVQGRTFDMIFVDGVDHLRREFAIATRSLLRPGGIMLFHDTRRFADFQNVAWVAQLFFNEIRNISVNTPAGDNKASNITIISKKAEEPYVNWNHAEEKPMWAYGSVMDPDLPLWSA